MRITAGSEQSAISAPPQANAPPPAMPSSAPAPGPTNGLIEITFTSNPANALVIIGGMALGRTPFTTKLPPGAYKATFAVYGYSNSFENITIGPGYPMLRSRQTSRND